MDNIDEWLDEIDEELEDEFNEEFEDIEGTSDEEVAGEEDNDTPVEIDESESEVEVEQEVDLVDEESDEVLIIKEDEEVEQTDREEVEITEELFEEEFNSIIKKFEAKNEEILNHQRMNENLASDLKSICEDVEDIINNSGAKFVVDNSTTLAEKFQMIKDKLSKSKEIIDGYKDKYTLLQTAYKKLKETNKKLK